MKPENPTYVKRYLTDADRDICLKLLNSGLSYIEVVNVMHISKSTVSYIKQCVSACNDKDWDTLRKLSSCVRPTVDWALKITNTADEYAKACEPDCGEVQNAPETVEPAPATVPTTDVQDIKGLLSGIYNMLSDIRDVLNSIK